MADVNGADYYRTGHMLSPTSTLAPLRMVQDSLQMAKDIAEQTRQAEMQCRLDAFEDDYRDTLRSRIAATFERHNADELNKVLDSSNNPLKRIVNEISTIYTRPPVWKFDNDSTAATWREIMEGANADVVCPEINRMVNLLNDVLVYVRPCQNRLVLKLVLPQDATVWPDPDDPAMPLACMFREHDPTAPNSKPVYHMWDRREGSAGYRMFGVEGRLEKELPNPYFDWDGRQVIPVAAYHRKFPVWSFWDQTSGDDLYELTLMLAMWETWINHLFRTDSIRQKYATGQIDATADQQGGTTNLLSLRSPDGTPVSVGEFSSQSDWAGLGAQITRKLENVLNNSGLALSDFRTSGDPTSGFALRVQKEGLVEIRERQAPLYRTWDRNLYRVVASVWNFERTNPLSQIEGAELPKSRVDIRYASFQTAQTVSERAEELAMQKERISLGLDSPISIYLYENPGATEAEARAAIQKNRDDTDSLKPPALPPPPMILPADAQPEAEEDESGDAPVGGA